MPLCTASHTWELWGALRKPWILLVVQILSTMDMWVKVGGGLPSLMHSFPEGEDGAAHGAQHRLQMSSLWVSSQGRAGTLGRIPGENPWPSAWAQGHPNVALLFTCLQQTWTVGSETFGSCSSPCAEEPRVSKGLAASSATSSSSAVQLPSLTWLLAPLGHQNWEATLSCPVHTHHSTRRNTPERTALCTNTRLQSKAAYSKYHYNNTNQQHNLITPWCTFNQDYLILHLCASFPLLSRTRLLHIYFYAVLQCTAWLGFTFLYQVPPLQVLQLWRDNGCTSTASFGHKQTEKTEGWKDACMITKCQLSAAKSEGEGMLSVCQQRSQWSSWLDCDTWWNTVEGNSVQEV